MTPLIAAWALVVVITTAFQPNAPPVGVVLYFTNHDLCLAAQARFRQAQVAECVQVGPLPESQPARPRP